MSSEKIRVGWIAWIYMLSNMLLLMASFVLLGFVWTWLWNRICSPMGLPEIGFIQAEMAILLVIMPAVIVACRGE